MNEKFFKSVCEKYTNTMSKEMLLNVNNKILRVFIEDDYIGLKENNKINKQNYKDYLDENFEILEYNTYQELYNIYIKDEIISDLNNHSLFDDNGKWNFYISFDELKQMGYGFMVKEQFPLIEKYIGEWQKSLSLFDVLSLDQLEFYEQSLYFYYIEEDIVYDGLGLISKNNYIFNSDIIALSEGLITYDDFLTDQGILTKYYILGMKKANDYFKENNIKDLMDYGSDLDYGLISLSSMYKEILNETEIKYSKIYTEDISDGKYLTTILFEDNSKIEITTCAWNDEKEVAKNIESVYEKFSKIKEKENEIEYDFN